MKREGLRDFVDLFALPFGGVALVFFVASVFVAVDHEVAGRIDEAVSTACLAAVFFVVGLIAVRRGLTCFPFRVDDDPKDDADGKSMWRQSDKTRR